MQRELRSADEIRDEVARLLNRRRKEPLPVPLPTRLVLDSDPFTDYTANWQMPEQGAWAPHRDDVRWAIIDVKSRWDLKT